MLRSAATALALLAACSTSERPAPKLVGPGDVAPIGSGSGSGAGGVAVVCGAAASEPTCTEADIEKVVNAAMASYEAKVEAVKGETQGSVGEAVEGARAAAVDDALLAVSEQYLATADAADTSEWAGLSVRWARPRRGRDRRRDARGL